MQLKGKIYQLLAPVTGTGKNGDWKKQEIIIETEGTYPKKICVAVWGDKVNLNGVVPGAKVTVDLDLESREINGRWFTDAKAWRITLDGQASNGGSDLPPFPVESVDDILPF